MFTVNYYSLKDEGEKSIGTYFKVKEFKCSDGSDPVFVSKDLVKVLDYVRAHFAKPLVITSAYRTPTYNKKIGGASKSMHMTGCAADFYVKGVNPATVYSYLCETFPDTMGIGKYTSFTHIDIRIEKTRWNG